MTKHRQNQRIVEINIVPSIGFNIFLDVIYNQVKFVGNNTTLLLRSQIFAILLKVVGVNTIIWWNCVNDTNVNQLHFKVPKCTPQVQHLFFIFKGLGRMEKGKSHGFHQKYKI